MARPKNRPEPVSKAYLAALPGNFDDAEAKAALENACRQLTGGEDRTEPIARFVSTMLTIAKGIRSVPPRALPAFSSASRSTCEKELSALSRAALALAEAVDELHQPTVIALADVGLAAEFRLGLPKKLRQLAKQIEGARITDQPPNVGRGARSRPAVKEIARISADIYRELTGRVPSFTTDPETSARTGPWPIFLEAVFDAIKSQGYGDRLVVKVAREWRERVTASDASR